MVCNKSDVCKIKAMYPSYDSETKILCSCLVPHIIADKLNGYQLKSHWLRLDDIMCQLSIGWSTQLVKESSQRSDDYCFNENDYYCHVIMMIVI